MKMLILGLIAALSFNAHAIEFESPESQLISLKFIKYAGTTSFIRGEGKSVLYLEYYEYRIVTAKGFSMPTIESTEVEIDKLRLFIKAVSDDCPLTITFDRKTGVIAKAKLACDPIGSMNL